MAAAQRRWAAEILHLWFHTLGLKDWFGRNDALDACLRTRFEPDLQALYTQNAESFLTDPLTARAAVLLFDQVPRNIYRGSAEAFLFDPLARAICHGALARGWALGLDRFGGLFLGLPLMHSEDIVDQRASVAYFTALGLASSRKAARDHYRMVARFGRFPHRNLALGRASTPAEIRAVEAGYRW